MTNSEAAFQARRFKQFVVVVLLVAAAGYFAPVGFYLLNCLGIGFVSVESTLGIDVKMKAPWYAAASSGNLVGEVWGLRKRSLQTVIYVKNNWLTPWTTDILYVSHDPGMPTSISNPDKLRPVSIGNTVGYVGKVVGSDGNVMLLPEFGLTFVSRSLSALYAVTDIGS